MFLGCLKFWPKGFFWDYERQGFFGSRNKQRDFSWYCIFRQLQINNIRQCNLLLVWDFFGYATKSRDFGG